MRNYPYLCGQLLFNNSLDILDFFFKDSNLNHEIRFSSHYVNGTYLRVSFNTKTELVFENIEKNEFLIRGESENESDLQELAEIVFLILSEHNLKHRLELYNFSDQEIGYYNHLWHR